MTNQEAIEDIEKNILPVVGGKSLRMAISALQAQADGACISRQAAIEAMGKAQWAKERLMELPSAQPEPCEDAVSREAVTDVIRHSDIFSTWYEMDDTDDIVAEVIDEARKQLVDDVNELPSVTPKCPECDDVVSRRAAIDVAENAFVRGLLASPDIRRLPSVQPESEERTAESAQNVPKEDLISRNAAIEAMSESLKRVFPEHRQIAEKCLKALPSAQPEPHWIPVSERLPDTRPVDEIGLFGEKCGEFMLSDPVLGYVCGLDDDVSMAVVWYEDDMDGVTGWTTAPDCMDVNVIAWMPLPEPYREVKWR